VHGPKCKKCGSSFKPGIKYKKLDERNYYHKECFTCYGPCRKPIDGEFYETDNGNFVCPTCYAKYGIRSNYADLYDKAPTTTTTNASPDEGVLGARQPTPPGVLTRDFRPGQDSKISNDDDDDALKTLTLTFTTKLTTSLAPKPKNDYEDRIKTKERDSVSPVVDRVASAKPLCYKCGQALVGSYSVFDEKNYHPHCFTCNMCRKEFKGKKFFKINDEPVCADCQEKDSLSKAPRCTKCRKAIMDSILTFMNEEYHEYCLVCTICEKKLMGQSIYTDNKQKPFCLECFTNKECKRCAKCKQPIPPNHTNLVFEDKPYHKECFVCALCKRKITSDESFYKRDNGEFVCEKCDN